LTKADLVEEKLVGGRRLEKALKNCSRPDKVKMKSGSKESVDICGLMWL
jgi:hypothetical protein